MICQLIFIFKAAPLRPLSHLSLFTKVLILYKYFTTPNQKESGT